MKKAVILTFIALLLINPVLADDGCSVTNLGACITETLLDFIVYIINLPVSPLVSMIRTLLISPVNLNLFTDIWASIVYALSMFYGLLIVISGFRFIVSGHSPEQREKAKSSLTNIIIMMILVQASFLLYKTIIEISSILTNAVFRLISSNFFNLTLDNLANVGLEITLLLPYICVLVLTLVLLVIRYLAVSIGVVFFALGIFFYFINPLNQYGRLIINFLMVMIFTPFVYSIIFLASSKLLNVSVFRSMKILVMMGLLIKIIVLIQALWLNGIV